MVVNKLKSIGFSDYEARAYIALLKNNPATAYEIAKSSGIPTSKIYEVLSRLNEKGVILELIENAKKRYIPMEPDEFVKGYRTRIEGALNNLSKELSMFKKETNVSYVWNIPDHENFVEKARQMISQAQGSILLSTWQEELIPVHDLLKQKEKKNIKIAIVHFGKSELKIGQIFPHPIEDTIYSEKGGRGFVLVVDAKEALMGTVFKNSHVEGAWSKNNGFVTLAEDYIKHDIYIMKIIKRFDPVLIKKFGDNYHKLRDIFNDEEVKKK